MPKRETKGKKIIRSLNLEREQKSASRKSGEMTEVWTSAVTGRRAGEEGETAPLCRFCFYCTRSFGNTVYPGFNGSVASLRASRGHTRSAGACTTPKVKGCSRSPPPGGRGKDHGLPPGSPRRDASPPAALARVRRVRGVPSSCALQAAGSFHPTGCYERVSPRCLNEGRWVAASGSSCNLPPSSPRPETVFLLYFFFSVPAAAASPHNHCRPLGGILWQLPAPSASGGMASTVARQPSQAHLEQQDG